ncbi:hypothetical protein P171DRAFT_495133 [Karstenula rhodostoma CBS 690.94]|uniref:Uncharacterized protein n=1 Tax=Karstenula rhodostoma CBS 690.94 TaxID=1392251 RepID=A0A9P4PG57_9PLEO|nr:hypothetical protein P171DRAFT_495133 [Karstenula rhodostoma CBS 690.94]
MAPTPEPRRSARLAEKAQAKIDPKTHARTPIQKPTRKSPRNLAQKKKKTPSVDLEQIEEQLAARNKKPQPPRVVTSTKKPHRKTPQVIEEPSSEEDSDEATEADSEDEFSMEDDSAESEDEFHENANMSHDHLEFLNSHDLQHSPGRSYSAQSYDSRLEPGNELYEQDDFVVDDEESVVMEYSEDSSGESEDDTDEDDLEINMERDPFRVGYRPVGRSHRASSIFSGVERRRRSSTAISPKTVPVPRRSSGGSYARRRSSSLFVSDRVGDTSISRQFAPWPQTAGDGVEDDVEAPLIEQASEEVVEEIIDAIALFSRRVYRNRPPVRLRLAAAVLEDKETRDALESAIRTGLGRKFSLADRIHSIYHPHPHHPHPRAPPNAHPPQKADTRQGRPHQPPKPPADPRRPSPPEFETPVYPSAGLDACQQEKEEASRHGTPGYAAS